MKRTIRLVAAFVLTTILIISIAQAESVNSVDITKELDRIKTQHDNGFVKEEPIDKGDLHYGWGLGVFYIQGYSQMTYDPDGNTVFLRNCRLTTCIS